MGSVRVLHILLCLVYYLFEFAETVALKFIFNIQFKYIVLNIIVLIQSLHVLTTIWPYQQHISINDVFKMAIFFFLRMHEDIYSGCYLSLLSYA